MAYVLADNIISPLGGTSAENYRAVKCGKSGLRAYKAGSNGVPEPFTASLLCGADDGQTGEGVSAKGFEELVEASVRRALADAPAEVRNGRTALIISSTKGDVDAGMPLAESARRIGASLGLAATPIVVCNACISGLSALVLACRLLDAGLYDYAVVCGADVPGRFITSGFQSLKALSSEPCRPFDMERFGLNLGEAAATMVLAASRPRVAITDGVWQLSRGCIRNDAFHISAPSKTGEGLYLALSETLRGTDTSELALLNAHGTATLFNDQMESVAIERAGLSEVPMNALKGYFGHTLGAAGILETIVCMKSVADGIVLATRGFEELGVSGKVDISADNHTARGNAFVKMLSGFGGCNATILARKDGAPEDNETLGDEAEGATSGLTMMRIMHRVTVNVTGITIDGTPLHLESGDGKTSLLTEVYRQKIGNYPKFYKMDKLCRLGFVASELLLQAEGKERFEECDNRAVVFFNRTSSVCSDMKYKESISDAGNYFPSPAVFVYTLPNIVTGEIAIRNHYHGETSFYILPQKDERIMHDVLGTVFADRRMTSVLGGWIDYDADGTFEADLFLAERQ